MSNSRAGEKVRPGPPYWAGVKKGGDLENEALKWQRTCSQLQEKRWSPSIYLQMLSIIINLY